MKFKKVLSGLMAFIFAVSLIGTAPVMVSAVTTTVTQTVFEMDIEALEAGTIPTGVELNSSILDETATSASAGLISDVVTTETGFLAINLATAESGLEGTSTGVYTVEFVLNAIDGDNTAATKNGNIIYVNGENTAEYMIVRSREKTDFTVLRNNWNGTEYKAVTNVETAHYTMTGLNVLTGAAASHTAKFNENSYLFSGVAHDSALAEWTGSPITGFTFKVAANCRANIKSIKITRTAEIEIVPQKFSFRALTEDLAKGTVSISGIDLNGKATEGDDVTITAVPSTGYIFDGWYKDGADTPVSTDAEYVIEASAETAGDYVAKFIRASVLQQTVFEMDIAALKAGTVPTGVTFNNAILDETATGSALVSDVVTADTAFITIDLAAASASLPGTGTGRYTIELITNVNDSDSTTKNGTSMFLKGISDKIVFRAREASDICAMPNSWADLHWQANTGATASYGMENLNVKDGSAEAHYAMRDSSPQYSSYANGHALAAGNANASNPINILTIKAAKDRRANIKSFRVVREAVVPYTEYTIGAESEDDAKGSVTISATTVETGESVTLTATPAENHIFVGWFDAITDELASAQSEWTFEPTASKDYVAKFLYVVTYVITAESADNAKGTVTATPDGPYIEGADVTLKATALSGYIFDGWYKDGAKVSGDAIYTLEALAETEGNYFAKFISAQFQEQPVYTVNIEGVLEGTVQLPAGITLNDAKLDTDASLEDNTLKSQVNSGAESFVTVDLEELVQGLSLDGNGSGIYKVTVAVNVKDDAEEVNGTEVYAVNVSGEKKLLTASEATGVLASKGDGMNGGGDSYNRAYVTYEFELNVNDGTLTSMLTDQTGSNIFSSVANGQTVTVPGITSADPVTKIVIKNIAGQRANVKSLEISRNITFIDYGNDTPIFNETCVKLIDTNGEVLSGNNVTAAVKTIAVDFRSVLDEATVNLGTVYVAENGVKMDAEPVHNDGIVTFAVNGLLPNSTYTVVVDEGVKNKAGASVRSADSYTFTTKGGECIAEITSVKADGSELAEVSSVAQNDVIDVTVKYINTNTTARDLYVVYAAYKNNALAEVKAAEYKNIPYTVSGEFNPTFTVGDMTGVTSIKIFAFDNWNTMNMLDSAELGAAFTCGQNSGETKVVVDNSANKIVVSSTAGDDDIVLVEVIKGNKQHSQLFDGLSKTEDVYTAGIPAAFLGTVKGGFVLDVPVTETSEYTVYVKNLTTQATLLNGEVVTFADSVTYAALVNGLDTSNESAFIASLTDDVAEKLGMDVLTSNILSNEEKNAVKAKLYAEGLSSTDDKANRKMADEYAAMVIVNNNSSLAANVAALLIDCVEDTINADAALKDWYGRYITNTTKETSFVNKLLATEPQTSGGDKIATRANLTDALKVALVLEIAKAPNGYTNIGAAFEQFKSAFGRTSVSAANAVYELMVGEYANKSAFLSKYDGIVATLGSGGSGGGSTGGGGGGGSSSGGVIESNKKPVSEEEAQANQAAPMEKNIFTDIASVPWAQEAIVALKIKNVINGKTEKEFFPNDNITREEFTKLVVAAVAGDAQKAEIKFSDANPNEWYYSYIQKAKNVGLINGISETKFGVGQNITRQDMAVIIFNAAKLKNVVGNNTPEEFPFGDDKNIADYAKEAVYTLKTMGIINGVDENNFAPLATATRAEAAVMIYRLLLK